MSHNLIFGSMEACNSLLGAAFSTNFSPLDWVIVAIYLAVSLGIGIAANKFISNTRAYVVAGGAVGTSLNVASFIGTSLGLVTLMYAAIEGFNRGFSYMSLAVIQFVIVGGVIGSSGFVISKLRSLNLMTIPEFFEKRFSRRVRILAGTLCVVSGILNMGLFPRMGATFITYATGLGESVEDSTMIVNIITSLLIALVLLYTVLGGMVAVIITDYIQFIVLTIGMGLGLFFCLNHPDLGWHKMVDTIADERGPMMFNPIAENVHVEPNQLSPEVLALIPHDLLEPCLDASGVPTTQLLAGYGWVWIAFMSLTSLLAAVCWAPEASRALTAKNADVARKTFLWSSPAWFARLAIPALWGVAAFTLVAQDEELRSFFFPTEAIYGMQGPVHHPAAAMPLVLGKVVPTGLLGVLVAGLLAAFMSTHDSYLLCWASVIARDIVSPLKKEPLTSHQQILVTRVSIVALGAFLLIWGIWYELPESVWNYMAVSGSIYIAGAGVSLVGGCYWSRASTAGAWAGMLTGVIGIAGLFLGGLNDLLLTWGITHQLTVPEVGLFNFLACTFMFIMFSLLVPDRPAGISPSDDS